MQINNNRSKCNNSLSLRESSYQKKKRLLIIALACVAICIVSGITLAYTVTKTGTFNNLFSPSHVSCEVIEDFFDGVTKSNVRVKNTGDTDAYIRAAVVVTWISEDESKVTAVKPVEGNDYEISYGSNNWESASDGFFYYKLPVKKGDSTSNLIDSCVCKVTPPEGFYLSVEIVASSIQASPTDVVLDNWKTGINGVDADTHSLVIKK